MVDSLTERALELRPLVERDGQGLTELEFVVCMILELGILEFDQVRSRGAMYGERVAWRGMNHVHVRVA